MNKINRKPSSKVEKLQNTPKKRHQTMIAAGLSAHTAIRAGGSGKVPYMVHSITITLM
jgi:hypothetical protein